MANLDKGTFFYFAGDRVSPADVCPQNMVQYILSAGEYIVCKIEAESFEDLVTTALNQANKYLFETWLPKKRLKKYLIVMKMKQKAYKEG